MARTTISHDGFARQSTVRESVSQRFNPTGKGACKECGQQRRTLYRYGTERDDRLTRDRLTGPLFCSIGCARAYNS